MSEMLKQYLIFSSAMQLLISLGFLGSRLANGMPVNEAVGRFFMAVAFGLIVNAIIAWILFVFSK